MKLNHELYDIIEISGDASAFRVRIKVNPDHLIYSGHFPDHPVTPGVVQLQMIHELLEWHLCQKLRLLAITESKFLKIWEPQATPQLLIHIAVQEKGNGLEVHAYGEDDSAVYFRLYALYKSA